MVSPALYKQPSSFIKTRSSGDIISGSSTSNNNTNTDTSMNGSNTYAAPQRPWRLAPDGSLSQDDSDEVPFGTPSARRYSLNNGDAMNHSHTLNGTGARTANRELRQQQEALINSYEAEEERIINSLVRKLEEVCVLVFCILDL